MATNYTGNATPTLSNAPANSWATDAEKRSHVGNTYLVTGSGGTSGNVYAFEKYPSAVVKEVPASGLPAEIVTITDGGENLPMTSAEVSLSPQQDLNGYDSPWPGGGGKNKLGGLTNEPQTYTGITITPNGDGTFTANGTNSGGLSDYQLGGTTPYAWNLAPGNYYLNGGVIGLNGSGNTLYIAIKNSAGGSTRYAGTNSYGVGTAFTIEEGEYISTVFIRAAAGATATNALFKPMIRLASESDATFAPYSNICPISGHTGAELKIGATYPTAVNTYSVTFSDQGTVYGGTFDFVSGKLTVTMASVDLGTLTWTYHTQSGNMYAEDAVPDRLFSDSVFAICERYVRGFNSYGVGLANVAQLTTNGAFSFMSISLPTVKGRVVIRDTAYTDAATFKTAMNGVKLVYELATPIEYTLSAQQIETLLGENNVWSDAGEISNLVYRSNQYVMAYDWFETWTMPKITRNNGNIIVLPYPQEYTPEIYDVDASTTGRNAAGTIIRDRVARKHKFNYKFPPLGQADATEILNAVQDSSFTLTTASPETGAKTNYRVYVGDRSLPVYWMPNHNQNSWLYETVTMNLIEM